MVVGKIPRERGRSRAPWSLISEQAPQNTHFPHVHLVKASGRASKDFRDWGWFTESPPEGRSCEVTLQSVWVQGWCNLELLSLAGAGGEGGGGPCRTTDVLPEVPI